MTRAVGRIRTGMLGVLLVAGASAALLGVAGARASAEPLGTAFTYQGFLKVDGSPQTGSYDFEFRLFDAATSGSQVGSTLSRNAVDVRAGVFTATLDFGGAAFAGEKRWLEMGVRTAGGGAFTVLPRQELTAVPAALSAVNADNATNASQLGGQLPGAYVAKAGDTMTGTLNLPPSGLTVGTSQLAVDSNGFVGVGTASPGVPLGVVADNASGWSATVTNWSTTAPNGLAVEVPYGTSNDDKALQVRSDSGSYRLVVTNAGNVGIGTASPGAKLEVVGAVRTHSYYTIANVNGSFSGSGGANSFIGLHDGTKWGLTIGTSGTYTSNVGIGTTTPGRKLSVNGDAGGTTVWYNDSDERLKKDIATIDDALARVLRLRGVTFQWRDTTNRPAGTQIGFIAQEALPVIPEVVEKRDEFYSMATPSITALLVEAIKEQQKQIDALKAEVAALKAGR